MPKGKPLISVVMPTYNRPSTIVRAIKSALIQSYENIEIVITDNSSGDETKEIIEKTFPNNSKILYIKNPENLGAMKNVKNAIGHSNGEYCVILPDDDWFCNAFYIEDALGRMNRDGTSFVVAACLLNHGEDDVRLGVNTAIKVDGKDFYRGIWSKYWIPGISCLFKKSLLLNIEYCHDEKIHYWDHDIYLKFCALTDISCYNIPSQNYNFHEGNDLTSINHRKLIENASICSSVHEFWSDKGGGRRDYRDLIVKYCLLTCSIYSLSGKYVLQVLNYLPATKLDCIIISFKVFPRLMVHKIRRISKGAYSRIKGWLK